MAIHNERLTENCQYNIHAPYEQMGDEICLSRIRVISYILTINKKVILLKITFYRRKV
jgi:hypothetical protein